MEDSKNKNPEKITTDECEFVILVNLQLDNLKRMCTIVQLVRKRTFDAFCMPLVAIEARYTN